MSLKKDTEIHTSGAKIEILRDKNRKIIRKSFEGNTSKIEFQYSWLLKHQHLSFIPKVFNSKKEISRFSYEMEYYQNYSALSDLFYSKSPLPTERLEKLMAQLLGILDQIHGPTKTVYSRALGEKYLKEKVFDKLAYSAKESSVVNDLLKFESLNINGVEISGWPLLAKKLKEESVIERLGHFNETEVHGDFTLDNILINEKDEMIVLDPNNENFIASPSVDIAKLFQSFHSQYEGLCKLDSVVIEGNSISYQSVGDKNLLISYQILERIYRDRNQLLDILLHEAIHFSRLLPYRIRAAKELTPIFLAVTLQNFNHYFAQYERSSQAVVQ
ncbi:MAG: hypothetical protein HN509_03400 [Halobacteriovoraceae bacterium]|nr:hypothetical protein [Halobacteriovoraceae bacterium]MBT5096067.1 hypothetical protein [Halobacteriovoraceae bacterium]